MGIKFDPILGALRESDIIVIQDVHNFVDATARNTYFDSPDPHLNELVGGLEIIVNGEVQRWTGLSNPATYIDTNWQEEIAGTVLTASEIKALYESNSNTNALIDEKLAILNVLSQDSQGIVSSLSFRFPPGSIRLGDSVIESGARIVIVRSDTTGNVGAFVIQVFNDTKYQPAEIVDDTQLARTFDVQTSVATSLGDITETNVRQVVQADVHLNAFDFMPSGDIPASFDFSLALSENGNPVYSETIDTTDSDTFENLGDGIYRVHLINVSVLDAGFDAYITYSGIALLGGNGFDGTDNILFGDATKSNFFPWLRTRSIPLVRLEIAPKTLVIEGDANLQTQLDTLASAAFNSGRAFTTFNDDIVIDDTNILTYEDRNNIYAAKIDKIVDVFLPSDSDIANAGVSYPVAFEFTHLAGTGIIPGNNLLRVYIADGNVTLSADSRAVLRQNQVAVISKSAAGEDWITSSSVVDPMSTLLPSGIFALQIGQLANIPTISTDFAALTIESGEAFIVGTSGTRFGADISTGDVIVALVDTPSLSINSTDWLVISNKIGRSLTTDEVLFFNQLARDGVRFDMSSNVFVNPANVIIQSNEVSGLPIRSNFVLTPNSQNVETVVLGNTPLQFTELTGGRLTLQYNIITTTSGGFLPEFRTLSFDYGNGIVFTFNILNQITDGLVTLSIDIPNVDYTLALNTNPTVSLVYIERGFQWLGTIMFSSMINTLKGTLHDSIIDLITSETQTLQSEVTSDVTRIDGTLNSLQSSVSDIVGRLDHDTLNLPDAVVGILKNDIKITQEDNVSRIPSDYNRQLGGMTTTGAIEEENSVVSGAGVTDSAQLLNADSTRRGMKLFYPVVSLADGSTLLTAMLGPTTVPLITRVGDNLVAKELVPAHGGGTRTVTHYPAPSNNFGSDGRWFLLNLKTATFQPVSVVESFTNEIPTTTTNVNVFTRVLVNGNRVDSETHILSVGGADTSISFVENSGSELVNVTVRYRSQFNDIEVLADPSNVQGLAIADLEVRMEWSETVTEASFPVSSVDRILSTYTENMQLPIAVKPSIVRTDANAATVVIVTENGEVDTGYTFNQLFGSTDTGFFRFAEADVPIYDINFEPNQLILTDLVARIRNPYFGLFTDDHTESTVIDFDTQISAKDRDGNTINFGTDLIMNDTDDNTQYRLTIDKGVLVTTQIV